MTLSVPSSWSRTRVGFKLCWPNVSGVTVGVSRGQDETTQVWPLCQSRIQTTRRRGTGHVRLPRFHALLRHEPSRQVKTEKEDSDQEVAAKFQALKEWFRSNLTTPTAVVWRTLREKLQGHYQYYNVNDNWRWVMKYREAARRMGLRWFGVAVRTRGPVGMPTVTTCDNIRCQP